jgi:(S)-ureidoglycine aminohydrolase
MKDAPLKPVPRYWAPFGGLPGQHELLSGRAVFTEAYAFIPRGVMTDIVTSALPFWEKTRAWIVARPMSGFSETFSQYIMEVLPGGGSDQPEPDPNGEGVLFVLQGGLGLDIGGTRHDLEPGAFAFIPPGTAWSVRNGSDDAARFHWIRKSYEPVAGLGLPGPVVGNERDVKNTPMPDTDGRWTTTTCGWTCTSPS